MKRKTQIIPIRTAAKILQKAGAPRVSKDAAKEFAGIIQDIGLGIAEKAVKISKHSGRRTVLKKDIELTNESL